MWKREGRQTDKKQERERRKKKRKKKRSEKGGFQKVFVNMAWQFVAAEILSQ